MSMKIKIKKLNPNVQIPLQQTEGACCADVTINDIEYYSDNLVEVKLGFSTEFKNKYKGIIVPRSSFTQKGWIMQNSPAQIDSDYRGEWKIKFEAIPLSCVSNDLQYSPFPYGIGERCAQIFFEKVIKANFETVEELSNTERGEGSFGSTGS